jgi:hypothetical protein
MGAVPQVTYKREETIDGVFYEVYRSTKGNRGFSIDEKTDGCFAFVAGKNVTRQTMSYEKDFADYCKVNEANYMGMTPALLAEETGKDVYVVYSPDVSMPKTWNPFKRIWNFFTKFGLTNEKVEAMHAKALVEITSGKQCTPIYHSYANSVATGMRSKTYREQIFGGKEDNLMSPVYIGPFTNPKDVLTIKSGEKEGQQMKLRIGIGKWTMYERDWYDIFKSANGTALTVPAYVFAKQELHDNPNDKRKVKAWAPTPWVNLGSASHIYQTDLLEAAQSIELGDLVDESPLGIVTMHDNISSPDVQRQILEAMGAKVVNLESGHRPFTHRVHARTLIAKFEKQHRENLERLSA